MYSEYDRSHHPDGLALAAINALIREVYAELAAAPEPTSALLDRSAAERRHRRMERQTADDLDRALPVYPKSVTTDVAA